MAPLAAPETLPTEVPVDTVPPPEKAAALESAPVAPPVAADALVESEPVAADVLAPPLALMVPTEVVVPPSEPVPGRTVVVAAVLAVVDPQFQSA